ncbi:MAG TPA: helix-turn-helix transcriptional regulator, partial [Gaiella sp.]
VTEARGMTSLLGEILEGEPLTARERDVLAGAADGETAEQTGARLYLSSETVKSYRKRVIAKLGAKNGTHAVALALRTGLLPLRRPVAMHAVTPRRVRR